jgi:hypothetical protein
VDVFVVLFLPTLAWLATIAHVVRTQDVATGTGSQTAWLLLVILVPVLGMVFYWLSEAPRRRRRASGS